MSGETYAIVFKGEVVDGFDAAAVRAQLSKLLKADTKKTAALFSGKQIVLKKTADKAEAAKYGRALKKVGADVKIKVIKAEAPVQPAPPKFEQAEAPVFQKADPPQFQKADDAPPSPFQAADPEPVAENTDPNVPVPDFTLAPNEGDLFEPQPEQAAVEVDISDLELAENDDTPLAEPAEEIIVELDLSEFSVKDNDGTPLVEASNEEVPEVEAPDFGLDEPGAVLETLQEEKELLNPNTLGMTLAATGSDLIEEDEKAPTPPPVAPDTSKINLVPNFDI
ncbi:MAG: hypothetical protein JJ921_10355 [Pseudomonadales bacterium]|nr:hypothetical protein [Pseudomonadales bacterium]MBO6564896.1 hypothetical protein [Pseudomonadales bacterium]MBO6596114.1 hypothetical protein [Pseudomonadales bacterium]MBO6702735.1 hypothetical protein [Pseudomonadales bacterium]MBO6822596.1 hypothetical protein [Pseudomonadales bacterium]